MEKTHYNRVRREKKGMNERLRLQVSSMLSKQSRALSLLSTPPVTKEGTMLQGGFPVLLRGRVLYNTSTVELVLFKVWMWMGVGYRVHGGFLDRSDDFFHC